MRRLILAALLLLSLTAEAMAHASGRGFVMLLPTGYVTAGGAMAVLISFLAMSLLPERGAGAVTAGRGAEALSPAGIVVSLFSAAVIVLLLAAGLLGPHDPAENLLPLAIWTLWWVVIVLLHPLFGDIWRVLNPFSGLYAVLSASRKPPLSYPPAASYWPAVVIFLAFAWFQLVYPAPEEPDVLAMVVIAYLGGTMLAVMLFGARSWLGRGDPFSVFLSQLGAAAPFGSLPVRWPWTGLLALSPLPLSGMLFVLLTLSAITFDGFANTFVWLSAIGINPLDFPGRSAVMAANTLGLLGSFLALSLLFFAAVYLGWQWAGKSVPLAMLCGRLVYSLIPISIAYHFAHYLSDTLVNLQYLAGALNDPFHTEANLLGLADVHVSTSFQNTASGTLMIFSLQTLAIVLGHIIGVVTAHAMITEMAGSKRHALKLETPIALLMVAYTGFGLWLLAAPSIA